MQAQVIPVSLSYIIRAYSNPAAIAAKEAFVLIPTMNEVASAQKLLEVCITNLAVSVTIRAMSNCAL